MNELEFILDTETTGLSPRDGHRVVEIGILEMQNKVLTGRKFHHYINPERNMPVEAYRVHGISSEFLQDKPLFSEIVDEFLEFIKGGRLVIHNAPFDIKFLNHELSLLKKGSLELSEVIDTLQMARRAFPGARANLDALCKRFKIDNSNREYHGALKDSELLAGVYVELTGGRQSSFELKKKSQEIMQETQSVISVSGNGIIITPTPEEKALHEALLKKIT